MTSASTLYLIDGSSYIYRAYYAIRHLSSPTGFPTNALYGFTQMLLKVLKDKKPDYVAVVFDAGRVTFRTEIYPEYKANRAAMPDDLRPQIDPIKEMVRAFNIPVLELAGFEADDIIGTVARNCQARGLKTVVVTGDKDLMQIVGEDVRLLDTMKDRETGVPEVLERFGVEPVRVIDILGLAGDSSDNIPGVPGIGEKIAIRLIQEFGSLDALLERADEVKGKTGERLQEFADQARLSRRLATIDVNVPLDYSFADFISSPSDNARLADLFREYGFTTLMKELTSSSTLTTENYQTVRTESAFYALLQNLADTESFAIDLETTSLNVRKAEIVGISLALKPNEAFYLPIGHRTTAVTSGEGLFAENSPSSLLPEQLALGRVLSALKPLLEDPSRKIIGQNIKYDYQVLRRYGVKIAGIWCDTMLAAYLNNPGRQSQGLDSLAVELLDHKMISYSDLTGKGKEQIGFAEVDIASASRYSCEDADATYLLHKILLPKVSAAGMDKLFHELEMPLLSILAEMELAGVRLDLSLLAELSARFGGEMTTLEAAICALAPEPFNMNSPRQLGEVLFDKMKLPTGKKTKTKSGWSTNVEELERLAEAGYEIAALLVTYRGLSKLKSTYTDALPKLVDPDTGRVHTSYNQAVTNTGRLSSSDPNLQNIPIRSNEGRLIRRAFIAGEDHKILSADYSQIELRVLAHLSQDSVLCDAFTKDEDIHTRTASEVFEILPGLVTPEMRRQAKTVNFGVIYGQSAFSLAKQLGVSRKVAEEFIDNYKLRHSGAMRFLASCITYAREHGYVTTVLGRRLPITDISSSNFNVKSYAERNAINYPIQGSAADIIKQAMVRIDRRLKRERLDSRLIMQVHDELVFEVPEAELIYMERLVSHEMENALELSVPLKVDINYGDNWSEAH